MYHVSLANFYEYDVEHIFMSKQKLLLAFVKTSRLVGVRGFEQYKFPNRSLFIKY